MRSEAWIYRPTRHDCREILTFDKFHLNEKIARHLAISVDRHDAPIGAAKPLLQLGTQAFGVEDILIFRLRTLVDDLERDLALCFCVVSKKHLAHRTPPDQPNNLISPVLDTCAHGWPASPLSGCFTIRNFGCSSTLPATKK